MCYSWCAGARKMCLETSLYIKMQSTALKWKGNISNHLPAFSINISNVYRSYFLVIIDVNLSLSIKYFVLVYLLKNKTPNFQLKGLLIVHPTTSQNQHCNICFLVSFSINPAIKRNRHTSSTCCTLEPPQLSFNFISVILTPDRPSLANTHRKEMRDE